MIRNIYNVTKLVVSCKLLLGDYWGTWPHMTWYLKQSRAVSVLLFLIISQFLFLPLILNSAFVNMVVKIRFVQDRNWVISYFDDHVDRCTILDLACTPVRKTIRDPKQCICHHGQQNRIFSTTKWGHFLFW